MDLKRELQIHEYQARRLRTEYAGDLLIRLLIDFDLAIRRVASRIRSLTSDDSARPFKWQ
jgi:hypothetical protein